METIEISRTSDSSLHLRINDQLGSSIALHQRD
jgi:hypothetical protein